MLQILSLGERSGQLSRAKHTTPSTEERFLFVLFIIVALSAACLGFAGIGNFEKWWSLKQISILDQTTSSLLFLGGSIGFNASLILQSIKQEEYDETPTPSAFDLLLYSVKENQKGEYPKDEKTQTLKGDYLPQHPLLKTNDSCKGYSGLTFKYYEHLYMDQKRERGRFDMHETHFQDFALRITNELLEKKVDLYMWSRISPAHERVYRARNYAIGARAEIGWDGKLLTKPEDIQNKKGEMLAHTQSCTLYHWLKCEQPPAFKNQYQTTFHVNGMTTEECVWDLCQRKPDAVVGWLNMANAHNTLGFYNIGGGSQEEISCTQSDAAALLGYHAEVLKPTMYNLRHLWYNQDHIIYKDGLHIPPGGNYCAKTYFLRGSEKVEAHMIATGFADFRQHFPGQTTFAHQHETERADYFDLFGNVKDQDALEARLRIDIRGVCLTAAANGITHPVFGASGCGAFEHNPDLEAKIWKDILEDEFAGVFEEVYFAIYAPNDPDKAQKGIDAQNAFKKALVMPEV